MKIVLIVILLITSSATINADNTCPNCVPGYPPPPPAAPAGYLPNYPPPAGYLPNYPSPPAFAYPGPPPPNKIVPWWPYYYRNLPDGNAVSASGTNYGSCSLVIIVVLAALLVV